MSAAFTEAARYRVFATCKSPIRTGGTERGTELVLCDRFGIPYFQGTSISGALRDRYEQCKGKKAAESLFGSQNVMGHLVISDGMFSECMKLEMRPRLRIDGITATAADRGKFDVSHLPVGTMLQFTITWMGMLEDIEQQQQVEQLLADLHYGVIRLGAQKTNGFGRVELEVRKQLYHMNHAEDRTAWLQDIDRSEPIDLPKVKEYNQILFTVKGHADNILVRSGLRERRSTVRNASREVMTPIREAGIPVLPGSSVKGVLRARVKQIATYLGQPEAEEILFGRGNCNADNGVAGNVVVDDVRLVKAQSQEISRIRINRFTGGVIRKGLFTEEAICSDVELHLRVPECVESHCGYLVYALRDLGLGLYNLGSSGAIGRGYMQVKRITVTMPDGRVGELLFDQKRTCSIKDEQKVLQMLCEQVERCVE